MVGKGAAGPRRAPTSHQPNNAKENKNGNNNNNNNKESQGESKRLQARRACLFLS